MKFLILNIDYPEFLTWLYTQHPGLEQQAYAEQVRARDESLHGVSDFYASNLRKLGHEAWGIYVNNECAQRAWAREHAVRFSSGKLWQFRWRRGVVPWISYAQTSKWMYEILAAQIKHYRPDIIVCQCIGLGGQLFREIKPGLRLLVGQHASPLPKARDLSVYDLILSSLPNLVDYFRQQGLHSELHRLGFEHTLLEKLGQIDKSVSVSFVGSLSTAHASRRRWLEHICRYMDVEVWGCGVADVREASPLANRYRGAAWGLDMYHVLQRSRMTLNHHIDVANSYANNMRLYEATGVGTLLITDGKKNLHEMFEPGQEVVAYRSPEECVELIQYYLEHDEEREAIAHAGQQRTLREHTYYRRMQELLDIVGKYL